MYINVSSLKCVISQVPGRVVTVVGMNVSSVKRVAVQVPGRVVTVVDISVNVSSVKRVMYRYLDESLRWLVSV